MLRKLRNRIKGQSTAEYAILIALVVAAIIAMQTYAKRALQAKVRDAVVYMKDQTVALGNSIQYEPYYLSSEFNVVRDQEGGQVLANQRVGIESRQGIVRAKGGHQDFAYNSDALNSTP